MATNRFRGCSITWFVAAVVAGCAGGGAESNPPGVSAQPTSFALPWVDRPLAHAPVRNAAGTTVEYFGGTVTANPKVYVVWWGDPANINSAVTAAKGGIADFYAGVTNSSYMDWLNEYNTNIPVQAGSHMGSAGAGQLVGRGNYAGTFTLSNIPSGDVTDAQIQTALDQALAAGTLPAADDNTLYAVYFPKGLTVSLDGSKSCAGFGAYHEAIIETQRKNTYYLVMPDCGSSFNGVTSVSSHELVEAMTDNTPTPASSPDYPQAWNDSMGNEVADLCNSSATVATPMGMFTVQTIWDNRTQACKSFSSDANDFNVSISPNVATVAPGTPRTFTVQTAKSGAAQTLTLSATAPTGVTATVSPTTVTAGGTAALTITAANPSAQTALQVIVRADATSGSVVQTHTAALLLSTSSASGDLGPPATDLGSGAGDLAQGPEGGDAGASDDLSSPGTGGNGQPTPPSSSGCSYVAGARANASATLFLLAFLLVAWSRNVARRAARDDLR